MKEFLLGSVVEHPHHGCGEVTFISDDYIGMRFSTGGDALLKRASFAALCRHAVPFPIYHLRKKIQLFQKE